MNLRNLRSACRRFVFSTPPLVRERDGTIVPARGRCVRERSITHGNAVRGVLDLDDAIERETAIVREQLATYHLAPELHR